MQRHCAECIGSPNLKQAEFLGHGADAGGDDDEAQAAGFLGSHSTRKYAATHACCCCCTKDEKEIRGRWKNRARMSDV